MAGALDGVRILDNGIVQAGTYPARLLADYGAEVVRVENYVSPDLSRNAHFPNGTPGERYWDQGGTYHEQHRNKAFCIGIDARRPEGRTIFLRLVAACDIVLDSHPPGVIEKLGLGYDELRRVKPDILLVTTSGYGHGGPYSSVRSYGMMTELMCGMASLNGYPGGEPRRGTLPITDNESLYHIAFLLMAALEYRDRTGAGAWIDVAQYEVGINVIGDAHLAHALGAEPPALAGNVEPHLPVAGCYPCDGPDAWVTLAVKDCAAWVALCDLAGVEGLARDRDPWQQPLTSAERADLDRAVAAWASARGQQECLLELQGRGIAAGAVNDIRDLLLDPHLEAREFYRTVDHAPGQGAGRRAWPGPAAQLSATPGEVRRRAPLLGEHNRALALGLLGFSEAEYEALVACGAFGTVPASAGIRPPAASPTARLQLGPWAMGRIKEYDADFERRLKRRFGPEFGADRPELGPGSPLP